MGTHFVFFFQNFMFRIQNSAKRLLLYVFFFPSFSDGTVDQAKIVRQFILVDNMICLLK